MKNVTELSSSPACLAAVIIHRPDAHPHWAYYLVSLVHMREAEGLPMPALHHKDSTHEVQVCALDPAHKPDPEDVTTIRMLTPPNLAYQLRTLDDRIAKDVFQQFAEQIDLGNLNPDSDQRRVMELALEMLVRRFRASS